MLVFKKLSENRGVTLTVLSRGRMIKLLRASVHYYVTSAPQLVCDKNRHGL